MGDTTKPLTVKQRAFIDAYMGEARGNATEAAKLAGYKGDYTTLASVGAENLRKPQIAQEVTRLQEASPLIATRDERLQVLTEMMRDTSLAPKDRQRAIELLSKACGDYIQRVEVSGPDGSAIKSEARLDVSSLNDEALKALIELSKG